MVEPLKCCMTQTIVHLIKNEMVCASRKLAYKASHDLSQELARVTRLRNLIPSINGNNLDTLPGKANPLASILSH